MEYSATESFSLQTPVGSLVLEMNGAGLCRLFFTTAQRHAGPPPKSRLARLAHRQLTRYFANAHDQFTLPLVLCKHTPFRQRVWAVLSTIKLGSTLSYNEMAAKLNTHPRAIGAACAANPLPIIIPCHRVIAQSGALGGYSAAKHNQSSAAPTSGARPLSAQALRIKAWLLSHERATRGAVS